MVLSVSSVSFNPRIQLNKTKTNSKNSNLNYQVQSPYKLSNISFKSNINQSRIATSKTRLGANFDQSSQTLDFKLASKNATDVFLCLFDEPKGKKPTATIKMEKGEGNIFKTSIKYDGKKPIYYGYRLFGANWQYSPDFFNPDGTIKDPTAGFKSLYDEKNNRFNPNKIAYDPYSTELSHIPSDNPYKNQNMFFTLDRHFEDNSETAVKSVFSVLDDSLYHLATNRKLTDEIIGEVHIKDLSINEDFDEKGSYLGAAKMAPKLKKLGITMVEFLPLNEFDDIDGNKNHWGYMPLSYFALSKKYAHSKETGSALAEFRTMIDTFHQNNIKVCLDVVFNHTGEGAIKDNNPNNAKALSYSLIDNDMYYKQKDGIYTSNSGCGNDFKTADDEVAALVADSIAFYAKQGVDAFRFDLAAALLDGKTNEKTHYEDKNALALKLENLLKERGVKVLAPNEEGEGIYLIAEPWTAGGDYSYHLGDFPLKWAEWCDKARETIKASGIFPESITPMRLREALEGTRNILKRPDRAINYAYSHDGYTLRDYSSSNAPLGSYVHSQEASNEEDKQIASMKKQIALVLSSKGTPMFQVGDLIAHSKLGNENSYNLDNEVNHLNFKKMDSENSIEREIMDFSTKMIRLRKNHESLKDSTSEFIYYDTNGEQKSDDDYSYWYERKSNLLSFRVEDEKPLFISISNSESETPLKLPENKEGKRWKLVCDTSLRHSFETNQISNTKEYSQNPNSVIIFEEVSNI